MNCNIQDISIWKCIQDIQEREREKGRMNSYVLLKPYWSVFTIKDMHIYLLTNLADHSLEYYFYQKVETPDSYLANMNTFVRM